MANEPETALALLCARAVLDSEATEQIGRLLSGPLDWKRLWGLAEWHGLEPLMAHRLRDRPEVPEDARDRLARVRADRARLGFVLGAETVQVVRLLDSEGIPGVPYKGPALSQALYDDPGMRSAGDIDLLVRGRDLPRTHSALLRSGYTCEFPLAEREVQWFAANERCLVYYSPRNQVAIDLQWQVVPRRFGFQLPTDDLMDRRTTAVLLGQPISAFAAEDLLLVLCAHGSKHAWESLKWLADVARLLARPAALDWTIVEQRAAAAGMGTALRLGLLLARDALGADVPEQTLRADTRLRQLAKYVCERWPAQAQTRRGLWRYELMLESAWLPKARHLWRLAQSRTDMERREHPVSGGGPVSMIGRPLSLLLRVARQRRTDRIFRPK